MTKEQRTAIARIICDIIKAYNIVEKSKIRDMKRLVSEYSITYQKISDTRKNSFSDAANTLKKLTHKNYKVFFDHIYSIALGDNYCVPYEAPLLIALQYCLIEVEKKSENGTPLPKPFLISCPTGEASFNDQYMVYLESSYNKERNEELNKLSTDGHNNTSLWLRLHQYSQNCGRIPRHERTVCHGCYQSYVIK